MPQVLVRCDLRARARAFAVAAGVAGLLVVVPTTANSDTLTLESFTGATVTDPGAWVAGGTGGNFSGWPGEACLTASTDTSQTPIAGCDLAAPDAVGSGVLNLTPPASFRAGFALYNRPLPTSGGLDITFQQAQWGGSGADGIAFFLVDGASDLTQPGQAGGSLGYATRTGVGPGVSDGLLGVGIDFWGEFSNQTSGGSGCVAGTGAGSTGPGRTQDVVAIRGPGDGTAGYCWLGASANLSSLGISVRGATRAAAETTVRIVLDPSTAPERNVTVYLDGQQVLQVPAPQELIDAASFKFGFGGATGDVTDNHDVWDLAIESVTPVTPPTTTPPTTTPPLVSGRPSFTG